MDKFGAQQEEIELLELENAELERKLTDVSSNLSPTQRASESESREDANDRSREVFKLIANTVANLSDYTESSTTEERSREERLNCAHGELAQVQQIFEHLEELFQEEQKKLISRRDKNNELRRKLSLEGKENLERSEQGESGVHWSSVRSLPLDGTMTDSAEKQKVIVVEALTLLVANREPVKIGLKGSDRKLVVREGTDYRFRVEFVVLAECVKGLKYIHKIGRLRMNMSKQVFTLGNYTRQSGTQSFTVKPDPAPKGVFNRGKYSVKSQLVDESGQNLQTWNWTLKVVKNL